MWDGLADPASAPVADLALGVDVAPSRDAAVVCLAGRRADGRPMVEWYHSERGVAWLPAWVDEHITPKVRAVVVDERGALAELDWAGSKVRPTLVGHREVAVAAGQFWDAVVEGTLAHTGQVELSKGVLNARQRPMMGGAAFGWDRKAAGSSTLIAASLALWGVTAPRATRPRRSSGRAVVRVLS